MDTIEFALACYRAPLRYQEHLSLSAALPTDFERLLWLANDSPDVLAEAVRSTGAKPGELREAARFCIQQLCFARNASPHRLLGVEPGCSPERIKEHHRLLMRLFHPDRSAGEETWTDHYAARVNEAYRLLLRPRPHSHKQGNTGTAASRQAASESSGGAMVPHHADVGAQWGEFRRMPPSGVAGREKSWTTAASRQRVPGMVLGGTAFVAGLMVWVLYTSRPTPITSTGRPAQAQAVETVVESSAALPEASTPTGGSERSAINTLLLAPDWQVLGNREAQAAHQVARVQDERRQLEEERQVRLTADEVLLARLRQERADQEARLRVEHARVEQFWAEHRSVEQRKLERLRLDQERIERLTAERLAAEQQRLESLLVEQAQAERQLEALRREREKARAAQDALPAVASSTSRGERLRSQQALLERQQADQAEQQVRSARDLTMPDLERLVSRYTGAYERGDLGRLMGLFAAQAQINGGQGLDQLGRDYAGFFATTRERRISLRDLRWARRGPDASGVARYELHAVKGVSLMRERYQGTIRFDVQKHDGQVRIVGFHYDIQSKD